MPLEQFRRCGCGTVYMSASPIVRCPEHGITYLLRGAPDDCCPTCLYANRERERAIRAELDARSAPSGSGSTTATESQEALRIEFEAKERHE